MSKTMIETTRVSRPSVPTWRRAVATTMNPPLLQQVDTYLLLNHPWLWTMKLHRLAYFGGLLWIYAIVGGLLTPIGLPAGVAPFMTTSVILLTIGSLVMLVYWFYGQDFFHLERESGESADSSGWREFSSYIIALLYIAMIVPAFLFVSQQRIYFGVNQRALAADIVVLTVNNEIAERYGYRQIEGDLADFGRFLQTSPAYNDLYAKYLRHSYGYTNHRIYNEPVRPMHRY